MPAIAVSRPLVGRFIPEQGAARIAAFVGLALLGTLALWISAKLKVPFLPVPVTLQTLAIPVLAACYGLRLGVATVLLYLAEGAVGLPVFTNGGGVAHFFGPTGGYLVGFVAATAVVGWYADRFGTARVLPLFAVMLIADAVIFALGFSWLAWGMPLPEGGPGIGAAKAFAGGVAPFVVYDLVKVALAATGTVGVSRALQGL